LGFGVYLDEADSTIEGLGFGVWGLESTWMKLSVFGAAAAMRVMASTVSSRFDLNSQSVGMSMPESSSQLQGLGFRV